MRFFGLQQIGFDVTVGRSALKISLCFLVFHSFGCFISWQSSGEVKLWAGKVEGISVPLHQSWPLLQFLWHISYLSTQAADDARCIQLPCARLPNLFLQLRMNVLQYVYKEV